MLEVIRVQLRDIAKVRSGTTPSRGLVDRYFTGGTIPWVKTGDLNNSAIESTDEKITDAAVAAGAHVYPVGTVLVAMYDGFAQIGRTGILSIPAAVNQAISALLVDREAVDPEYVLQFLNCHISHWKRFAASSRKDPNITRTDVENFPIALPPLPEQRRIAKILRTWDNAVETTERIILQKERRRDGLLEGLARGDFGGDYNNEKWIETSIKDIMSLTSRRAAWDDSATYRLITVKRACGGIVLRGDRKGAEIKTKEMYVVHAGDFVISKRQVVHGAWAMAKADFDGTHVSKEYACFVPRTDKLWMPFFDWLSRTKRLRHQAFLCSYGVDIEKMVLDMDWLQEVRLQIPFSLDQQQRIAELFDCVESEIELLRRKHAALKKQKRGLMQKLLTGAWRVPLNQPSIETAIGKAAE